MRALLLLLTFTFLFSPLHSIAETPEEYALKGRTMWSAFTCATYAEKAGKTEEQLRLFMLGYNEGKEFIDAIHTEKTTQEALRSNTPTGVMMRLSGPSDDFRIGRIFEAAVNDIDNDIYSDGENLYSDEVVKLRASTEYINRNCKIMGR